MGETVSRGLRNSEAARMWSVLTEKAGLHAKHKLCQ